MVERILVGAITGAHGVRGQVRIRSFTADPLAVAAYGPVTDEDGKRRFELIVTGATKGGVIARLAGIEDRTAAEALRGVRLYVSRAALPETAKDEYYWTDLIGLRAELADGTHYGRVSDVQNFGASDLLEIERADGASELLPFTDRCVPVVDLEGGRVVIDPPVAVEAKSNGAVGDG